MWSAAFSPYTQWNRGKCVSWGLWTRDCNSSTVIFGKHANTVLSSITSFGITESSLPSSFVSEVKMSVLFLNSNKEQIHSVYKPTPVMRCAFCMMWSMAKHWSFWMRGSHKGDYEEYCIWNVTPYRLVRVYVLEEHNFLNLQGRKVKQASLLFDPEYESKTFLRNVNKLPNYMV
jgi:hypothetical protein